ncbi:MAG: hypothetical protein COA78_25200 [Blastopirellula sp.]|nr:MAG: hypothetical protein COA78_25200 [Blastopirellula sp.]
MRKHIMIPDCQVTPDTPTDHLRWIGEYIVDEKPDVVVQIGDFADMESLSSFDVGKKCFEGRRYVTDIACSNAAMDVLMKPLNDHNAKKRRQKEKTYNPELHLTLGNHEYRIERVIQSDARLDGTLQMSDLKYKEAGWTVHDFLQPVNIDGIVYSHYFANPMSGKPYGGQSIDTRLKNIGFTFTMGHQQVKMSGERNLTNGQRIRGLVCGSCYLHDEDYIGPQGNAYWRGIFVKHEVIDGQYDLMEVSLDFLCRRYEGKHVWEFMKEKYPEIYGASIWMQYQSKRMEEAKR